MYMCTFVCYTVFDLIIMHALTLGDIAFKSSYLYEIFPINKNDYFIKKTDTIGYIVVLTIYTSPVS